MNDEDKFVTVGELFDNELLDLYNKILEHIKFLDNSILEEESDGKDNG